MGSLRLPWTKGVYSNQNPSQSNLVSEPTWSLSRQQLLNLPSTEHVVRQQAPRKVRRTSLMAEVLLRCARVWTRLPRSPFICPYWSAHFLWWEGALRAGVESWKVFATLMIFFFSLNTSTLALFILTWYFVAFSSPHVVNVTNVCMRRNVLVSFTAVGLKSDLPSQRLASDTAQCDNGEKEMRWCGHCGPAHLSPVTEGFSNHRSAAPGALPDSPGKQKNTTATLDSPAFSPHSSSPPWLSLPPFLQLQTTGGGTFK